MWSLLRNIEITNPDLIRILVSVLCGSILGIEREYQNKAAGFRTIILICLGATIFTILSQEMGNSEDRIAANIITGIGFIGAGVIFKNNIDVKGLTTAAVIWVAAAIGMVVGIQQYYLAIFLSLVVLVVLSLLSRIEKVIDRLNYRARFTVTFINADLHNLTYVEELIKRQKLRLRRKQLSKKDSRLVVELDVSGNKKRVIELNEKLLTLHEVHEV
ncbi:MAG TPA: MgtC/SapB family protein [Daejeonella sp.]|nr:MgtC/SapB family protein [Daejeonella sp.]